LELKEVFLIQDCGRIEGALQIGTGNAVQTVSKVEGITTILRSRFLFQGRFRKWKNLSGWQDMALR